MIEWSDLDEEPAGPDAGKPVVAVVDESRAVRSFITSALEPLDVRVQEYASGAKSAGELAGLDPADAPAVIIVETRYRDIEGQKLVKRLRAHAATGGASILVFTSAKDPQVMTAFLGAGADEYLLKPSKPDGLRGVVRMLLWNGEERARPGPLPEEPVLLVDTDGDALAPLREALNRKGHPVYCAGNAVTALRLCIREVALALVELDLPGIDGVRLVETLGKRAARTRVLAMGDDVPQQRIDQALQCGARDYLAKPIEPAVLEEKLESVLEPTPQLEKMELERQFSRRLLAGARPFPPLVEGTIAFTPAQLVERFEADPELEAAQVILSGQRLRLRGDDTPVAEDGTLLSAENARRMAGAEAGELIDNADRPVTTVPVLRTYDLGLYLFERAPYTREDLEARLRERPSSAGALAGADPAAAKEATDLLLAAFDYLDVYFYAEDLRFRGRDEVLGHALAAGLLAVLTGRQLLTRTPDLDPDHRKVLLSVLALGGVLHDIGLETVTLPPVESPKYLAAYPRHADAGHALFADRKTFELLKHLVRDHHTATDVWASKYDAATRVLQVANDLDNLTRRDGVIARGAHVQPSPEPYSFEEACLILADAVREGGYRIEEVDALLAAVGLATVAER